VPIIYDVHMGFRKDFDCSAFVIKALSLYNGHSGISSYINNTTKFTLRANMPNKDKSDVETALLAVSLLPDCLTILSYSIDSELESLKNVSKALLLHLVSLNPSTVTSPSALLIETSLLLGPPVYGKTTLIRRAASLHPSSLRLRSFTLDYKNYLNTSCGLSSYLEENFMKYSLLCIDA